MTHWTIKRALLLSVIWPGCLTLILMGSSVYASGKGYESHHTGQGNPHASMDMKNHGSPHQKANYSGHGTSSGHGSYGKGYGAHGKRDYGKHGGAHQSASEFIQHVLKYKEGMAITDEQEAKLHDINSV